MVLTGVSIEPLRDGRGVVLELLEQRRGDGQEVDTSKSLDLATLQGAGQMARLQQF